MDNVTGELPSAKLRARRASRRKFGPAGLRRASVVDSQRFRHAADLGTAGYYSRQNWVFNNHVDGWAGMTDWSVPLATRVTSAESFIAAAPWAAWVAA